MGWTRNLAYLGIAGIIGVTSFYGGIQFERQRQIEKFRKISLESSALMTEALSGKNDKCGVVLSSSINVYIYNCCMGSRGCS